MAISGSQFHYDVVVVGAGHAGLEAALATARSGLKTLVVTVNIKRIGYMSCNPSIGGLAKGHMVREIDVLGGEMGFAADSTCIQFKRLNSRRGPAVRGSRAQCDKELYSSFMTKVLSEQENISIIESEVKSLILGPGDICEGVTLEDGSLVRAKAVVLTTGTFMRGVMFVGHEKADGGRVGDRAAIGLSDQLRQIGLSVQRLKTGTPPRLEASSIDWSKTIEQRGDDLFFPFSVRSEAKLKHTQVSCFLSHTNEMTHDIIRNNLDKSPMYSGQIEGTGPRYCPSIEDKVTRFAEKISHQTFMEPESLSTNLIYLQGISTSLPADVQEQFLKTIPGLEAVRIARHGYAVEYDFVEPTQIKHTFECRGISHLYLAGQVNGTSGYEEAGAQGLLAGINASMQIKEMEPFVLRRDEAYAGVLIDDLVTKGTKEPYRMFTSRAEFRLELREDNTIQRLFARALQIGIIKTSSRIRIEKLLESQASLRQKLKDMQLVPKAETLEILTQLGTAPISKPTTAEELLRRPAMDISMLEHFGIDIGEDFFVSEAVEIDVKYEGYIGRQNQLIQQAKRLEQMAMPTGIDYSNVRGLSDEESEKLNRIRPMTLGQAERISGVNPSAIQALLIHLKVTKSPVNANVPRGTFSSPRL
jgi:tRNA uridine 5-carboxymethylaminomethyl modification enzyme